MKVLDNFYTINDIQSGEKFTISLELNPQHPIFEGHFPGNPIVPGVCMTQMVKEIVEQLSGKNLNILSGDNLKFTAVLNPLETPNVTMLLSIKPKENGTIQADATILNGETNYFSFKGIFKEV